MIKHTADLIYIYQNVSNCASRFLPKPKAPPGICRCPQFSFAFANTYQVPKSRSLLEPVEEEPVGDVVLEVVLEEEHPEAVPVVVVEDLVVSAVAVAVVVAVVGFQEVVLAEASVEASVDGVRYSAICRQYVCLSRSGVLGIGHGYFSFATAIMRIYKSLPFGEIKFVDYFIARDFYLHIMVIWLMNIGFKNIVNGTHQPQKLFSNFFFLSVIGVVAESMQTSQTMTFRR